jgi:hypothetical protein
MYTLEAQSYDQFLRVFAKALRAFGWPKQGQPYFDTSFGCYRMAMLQSWLFHRTRISRVLQGGQKKEVRCWQHLTPLVPEDYLLIKSESLCKLNTTDMVQPIITTLELPPK